MNRTLELQPMADSRPIREIAYEILKQAIISGEIQPGERIVETDYATRLHISRTPLREAMRKLEQDGLVEYAMRRGCVVRAFTLEDVEQVYTIHNVLTMLCLPDIINNATAADIERLRGHLTEMDELLANNDIQGLSAKARVFHNDMISISAKRRILNTIRTQDEFLMRFSALAVSQEKQKGASQKEHWKLVEYVESKNLPAFTELMHNHIETSKQCCIRGLEAMQNNRESK